MVALCVFMALWLTHSEQETTVPFATLSALIWLVCGRVSGVEIKENWNVVSPNVSGGVVPSLETVRVTLDDIVCWGLETFHCRNATLLDEHVSTSRSIGHNSTWLREKTSPPIIKCKLVGWKSKLMVTDGGISVHVSLSYNNYYPTLYIMTRKCPCCNQQFDHKQLHHSTIYDLRNLLYSD